MRFKLKAKRHKGDEIPWHKWFAWYPVTLDGEVVWLEQVHRKGVVELGTYGDPVVRWEYRPQENLCR